jgi:hypothetical protein
MLTYRRALLFLFVAAFAAEEARALRWALTLGVDVVTAPALWAMVSSAVALAANAGLIWGGLRLLGRWRHSRRGAHFPIEPPPGGWGRAIETDPRVPLDPVGYRGPESASWPEEGDRDEQRAERS